MKKQKENLTLIQMPFRCTAELQGMIMQALGAAIFKSGKTISRNDFIIHLLEMGLKHSNRFSPNEMPTNDTL